MFQSEYRPYVLPGWSLISLALYISGTKTRIASAHETSYSAPMGLCSEQVLLSKLAHMILSKVSLCSSFHKPTRWIQGVNDRNLWPYHPITGNGRFSMKTTVVGTSPNTKTEQAKSEQNLLLLAARWYTLPL
jgi:hypothetical protein